MRRCVKRRRPLARQERGAAAVEFALIVPFLVLLVFGIVSYGVMLSFRQTMSQAATEGARAAAVQLDASKRVTSATSALNDALATLSIGGNKLSCGQHHVTCQVGKLNAAGVNDDSKTPFSCGGVGVQCITVTVSYPYRDHPVIPSVPFMDRTLPKTLKYSATVRVS